MELTERLSPTNITDIMQTAYIDYSMSVIVSRALPDARDGLKPVQRRVLYAMLREGLRHNTAYDKCAGVVGEVLKNYHPHGDSSVYDTLVRLTQDWVMRYPLVDGQGNFGSIEGDSAAAYRYTECRLQELSERYRERFSMVLCNPPYERVGTGFDNAEYEKAICRKELTLTLPEIAQAAAKALKFGGRLCMVHRADRLAEICYVLKGYNLEVKRLQFVTGREGAAPYLLLIEAVKGGKPATELLPTLVNA